MPVALCFNPGSNSLKFDLIDIKPGAARASEGQRLLTGVIDNIGKETTLEITRSEEKLLSKKLTAGDFTQGTKEAIDALKELEGKDLPRLDDIDLAAVRVVHGGAKFTAAVKVDDSVRKEIDARSEIAPLHNPNALRVIDALEHSLASLPVFAAFDTAFHHTLPEHAWRYPIDLPMADRLGIRKFGFHGLSHRYMLEQYACLSGTQTQSASIVTMHLESGSSACAIDHGKSIDTSMGFTPLEGLMMGTRSGSIDPAILPFLIKKENLSPEQALNLLERHSGLLGISGVSLDTRILKERTDDRSRLALDMFGYRARQMAGAYLAVLGSAQAIVFGGGIGENTIEVRRQVCDGLTNFGLILDPKLNDTVIAGDARISQDGSPLAAWVIHSDEGMQLAYECVSAFTSP